MLAQIFDLLGEDCKGSILEGWLDSKLNKYVL